MNRLLTGVGLAALLVSVAANSVGAGDDQSVSDPDVYPTTTVTVPRDLALNALGSVCRADAPYINFEIEPLGFEPTTPVTVTVTIFDGRGDIYDTVVLVDPTETLEQGLSVDPATGLISGYIVYPGAEVGPDGLATDWPGYIQIAPGVFETDPTDDYLREGIRLRIEINPSIEADVSYPPSSAPCNGPDGNGGTTGQLPRTGSGSQPIIQTAAIVLAVGLLVFSAAWRRRPVTAN